MDMEKQSRKFVAEVEKVYREHGAEIIEMYLSVPPNFILDWNRHSVGQKHASIPNHLKVANESSTRNIAFKVLPDISERKGVSLVNAVLCCAVNSSQMTVTQKESIRNYCHGVLAMDRKLTESDGYSPGDMLILDRLVGQNKYRVGGNGGKPNWRIIRDRFMLETNRTGEINHLNLASRYHYFKGKKLKH